MTKKIAVIDGNSLMHRAYHAVPPTMNAPDGTPTNAVFGFCSMLFKFIEEAHPDAVVCAFDKGKPEFRIKAMEQYKAQRPPMDDELHVQFPLVESLLEALNIPVIKVPGWEGDDILGTVAARNEARGYHTLLLSGDKDINQLVSDLTSVVTTKKGVSEVVIFTPDAVFEKYGVWPKQFPDYLGFMGDSSDNIPGVPGVGPKSAQKLLAQFESMEGVYENLDKLKGKQLENVRDNRELAFLSRKIARIVCDLDFDLDVDAISWPSFDAAKVQESFLSIGFSTQLKRLMRLVGTNSGVASDNFATAALFDELNFDSSLDLDPLKLAETLHGDEAQALLERVCADGGSTRFALALAKPEQVSLFEQELFLGVAFRDDLSDETQALVFEGEKALVALKYLVQTQLIAAHDLKVLLHELYPVDASLPALLSREELLAVRAFDVALAAYDLNSSAGKYPLDELLARYAQCSLPQTEDMLEQVNIQAQAVLRLSQVLPELLKQQDAYRVYCDIDLPLIPVLCIMERNGAAIDVEALREMSARTQSQIDQLKSEIYALAGEEFNVDSPKQLGHILFEVLELPHGKKNARGYSTDAKVLKKLADLHPLPKKLIEYREFAKIKSTYLDTLPVIAARYGDKRIHTSFNETVTATGRLSSSDPNLQNIPVRSDFGRQIRACFGANDAQSVFLSADYSQIELRLLAHFSADEHLVLAFNAGEDFHANTAARIFDVPIDEVSSQMRSRAKAVNFGIVYGQQAFGLAQNLGISNAEAKSMIERYFCAYPGVRQYLDSTVEQASKHGFAETMFGRRRYIPELRAKNAIQRGFGQRTAMNHPMQGTAADIIKLAMIQVEERLLREGFKARLLLQVHDELDFSVPNDEIEALASMVKEVMEGVVSLRVPLIADVSWGKSWAEAH